MRRRKNKSTKIFFGVCLACCHSCPSLKSNRQKSIGRLQYERSLSFHQYLWHSFREIVKIVLNNCPIRHAASWSVQIVIWHNQHKHIAWECSSTSQCLCVRWNAHTLRISVHSHNNLIAGVFQCKISVTLETSSDPNESLRLNDLKTHAKLLLKY